jgi:predicted double-glycine peptidase
MPEVFHGLNIPFSRNRSGRCPNRFQRLSKNPLGRILSALLLIGAQAPVAAREPVASLLEMRRSQVVVQQWDISCGAAALATILNYQHGDMIPEREIAKALFQREEYLANPLLVLAREGFSLLDLKRYVEKRGYRGIGLGQLDLKELVERAPIMVPLNLHGYNHFVVFRGLKGNRVLLADPAWGNRTMPIQRFEDAWIDYPEVGRVGFVITRLDNLAPPNRLAPRENDFPILQ